MSRLFNIVKNKLQDNINQKNRKKLTNPDVTIIASNCTGGFLYHWLGLEFKSPFINLYMTPEDFITALSNFDNFMEQNIIELKDSGKNYPVGIGYKGTLIHFMHYKNFDQAISKWNERKERMNKNNCCVMLSNWGGYDTKQLKQFDSLPFKHKVVFTDRKYSNISSAFYLHGYSCSNGKNGNVYATQYINGKRYIDQFDYVTFFNKCNNT